MGGGAAATAEGRVPGGKSRTFKAKAGVVQFPALLSTVKRVWTTAKICQRATIGTRESWHHRHRENERVKQFFSMILTGIRPLLSSWANRIWWASCKRIEDMMNRCRVDSYLWLWVGLPVQLSRNFAVDFPSGCAALFDWQCSRPTVTPASSFSPSFLTQIVLDRKNPFAVWRLSVQTNLKCAFKGNVYT